MTPPQLSLNPVTLAMLTGGTCAAQVTVKPAGHVKLGGVWSFTVMTCVQVAELPHASVAR